jgi:hypothetical protein
MNHYEIKMIDTDPDTGKESGIVIAVSSNEFHASMISLALNETNDTEPNRHFIVTKFEKESCL